MAGRGYGVWTAFWWCIILKLHRTFILQKSIQKGDKYHSAAACNMPSVMIREPDSRVPSPMLHQQSS